MRENLKDVGAGKASMDERAQIAGADEIPVPGSDAEAAEGFELFVSQLAGHRQSEEVPKKPCKAPVGVNGARTVRSRHLDHLPVEFGEGTSQLQRYGVHYRGPFAPN